MTIKLDYTNVPSELHFLVPLAEKWGINNRDLLDTLLRKESPTYLENLIKAVDSLAIAKALYFPPLDQPDSLEAKTFRLLILAAGRAGNILNEAKWQVNPLGDSEIAKQAYLNDPPEQDGKVWLKEIGWPELYPGIRLDTAKVPEELHSLLPYIEKWITDDDGVRLTLIEVANDDELEALVSVVKQIGKEKIRSIAGKLVYDETRHSEGIYILILVEQAENAEYELKSRRSDLPKSDISSE